MGKNKDKIRVSLKSSGAAVDVTGSCAVVTWGKPERTILVDCGLIQGGQSLLKEYQANREKFCFKEKNVEYVFATHVHVDHTGRIALLTKRGFSGQVILPEGSQDLFRELALDCAKIMERNAEDLSHKLQKEYLPIYEEQDVKETMKLVSEYPVGQKIVLDDELSFEFVPAGHIISSCQLILYIKNGSTTRKLAFTGDLGNLGVDSYYANTFEPIKNANLLVGECTYANKERGIKIKDREKDLEKIQAIVADIKERGGKILFPSFSLMRSQVILTILHELYGQDEEFNIPIYMASPLTCRINKIFLNVLEGEQLAKWEAAYHWNKVTYIDNFESLENVLSQNGPAIFISSSGMLNAGYSVHIAEKLLPSAKNILAFIGYSVEGTLSWKIKQKKTKTISINGKPVPSRCGVVNLASFSSHIQREDIIKYYSGGMGTGTYGKIVLQHGNMKDRIELAKDIQEQIANRNRSDKVVIANKGFEITL